MADACLDLEGHGLGEEGVSNLLLGAGISDARLEDVGLPLVGGLAEAAGVASVTRGASSGGKPVGWGLRPLCVGVGVLGAGGDLGAVVKDGTPGAVGPALAVRAPRETRLADSDAVVRGKARVPGGVILSHRRAARKDFAGWASEDDPLSRSAKVTTVANVGGNAAASVLAGGVAFGLVALGALKVKTSTIAREF